MNGAFRCERRDNAAFLLPERIRRTDVSLLFFSPFPSLLSNLIWRHISIFTASRRRSLPQKRVANSLRLRPDLEFQLATQREMMRGPCCFYPLNQIYLEGWILVELSICREKKLCSVAPRASGRCNFASGLRRRGDNVERRKGSGSNFSGNLCLRMVSMI